MEAPEGEDQKVGGATAGLSHLQLRIGALLSQFINPSLLPQIDRLVITCHDCGLIAA